MSTLMNHLMLGVLIVATVPISVAQIRDVPAVQERALPDEPSLDTTAVSTNDEAGFYATIDGLGFGSTSNGLRQFGGTLGYRFGNGLELGAGLQRQSGPGTAYSFGVTAGYTHMLSSHSGVRLGARLTGGSDNLYDAENRFATYTPGFENRAYGGQQLRLLRTDVDAVAFHRIDLTRWMSVTPNAGVFATGTRHVNRDESLYGDHIGSTGLLLGLQTGLDLTFRLSDTVSLTLPLRLRLFPQSLIDDRTGFDFRSPTMGTGIRIDF